MIYFLTILIRNFFLSYSNLLGMYAFGLEETNFYEKAEGIAKQVSA